MLDPSTLMDINTYKEKLNFVMHFAILGFINIRRFNLTYELLNVKKIGKKKINLINIKSHYISVQSLNYEWKVFDTNCYKNLRD